MLSMGHLMNRYEQMDMLSKVVSWPQLYHILDNYRLFEYGWILQQLAITGKRLPPKHIGILDVGSGKSGFVNVLCSLGYKVDGVDSYSPPFHNFPNYTFIKGDVNKLDSKKKYQVITCISTIEHIGLNWGEEDDDLKAVASMKELLADDGTLLLTTHYGRDHIVNKEKDFRIYDDLHLNELLRPLTTYDIEFFTKKEGFWVRTSRDEARRPLENPNDQPISNVNIVLKKKE